jgi:hypothetical protein
MCCSSVFHAIPKGTPTPGPPGTYGVHPGGKQQVPRGRHGVGPGPSPTAPPPPPPHHATHPPHQGGGCGGVCHPPPGCTWAHACTHGVMTTTGHTTTYRATDGPKCHRAVGGGGGGWVGVHKEHAPPPGHHRATTGLLPGDRRAPPGDHRAPPGTKGRPPGTTG